MSNSDLYFYVTAGGVAYLALATLMIFWLADQLNKARDLIHRVDDRVTHVYDEVHKLDSKVNVKEAIQEAIAEASEAKED